MRVSDVSRARVAIQRRVVVRLRRSSTSRFNEVASVLVRLDHVASVIVNVDHSIV